jgi:hypothetical protein
MHQLKAPQVAAWRCMALRRSASVTAFSSLKGAARQLPDLANSSPNALFLLTIRVLTGSD